MARELAYTVLDVFAERALEGNALAVFHDARGLSDAQMQALARETNLSETTFVLPSDDVAGDRVEGVRVRIFTAEEELSFAGHPTLGTASWLHLHYPALRGAETVKLRLKVGPVPVRFSLGEAGEDGSVYGTMRQPDVQFGQELNPSEVASVLGVPARDMLAGYAPQAVSTGNPFCIAALASVETLSRLAIPQREASAWLRERGIRWFYCIAPTEDPRTWRTRMQWMAGEDPATGSAAGPCAAWLVRVGLVPSETIITIQQGVEMGRPSRLMVQATGSGEQITDVQVGGRTVPVATGRFFL